MAIWVAISLPIIVEPALFIRVYRLVVIGQLLGWLTTSVVASLATKLLADALIPFSAKIILLDNSGTIVAK